MILQFARTRLTEETAFLLKVASAKTRFAGWAKIDGVAKDGRRVYSEYVVLDSRTDRLGVSRPSVSIAGHASRLSIEWLPVPKRNRGLRVSYVTVGMRGFGRQYLRSRVGDVSLVAPAKGDDYDRLAGRFDVIAVGTPRKTDHWIAKCDELAGQILAMVSLAEGRLTLWSIRNVIRSRDDRVLAMEFYGPKGTGRPHDGVGHYLHLQPWVDLAPRYTSALRRRTGIDVALEWFLIHSAYHEFSLIAAMTALEHLVAKFTAAHRRTALAVHPKTFATIRRSIEPIFTKLSNSLRGSNVGARRKAIESVRSNMRSANRSSFANRLAEMLRAYDVPMGGFEADVRKAIAARNIVIHTGLLHSHENYRELYGHVVVLRELLKRIFLSLLGYTGQYFSMLNTWEQKPFPPVDHVFEKQDVDD